MLFCPTRRSFTLSKDGRKRFTPFVLTAKTPVLPCSRYVNHSLEIYYSSDGTSQERGSYKLRAWNAAPKKILPVTPSLRPTSPDWPCIAGYSI